MAARAPSRRRWITLVRELNDAIASLSELPHRCQLAPENASVTFELRQLLYGRKPYIYRVLFTIESDVVYVLRIRRGRRRFDEPDSSLYRESAWKYVAQFGISGARICWARRRPI